MKISGARISSSPDLAMAPGTGEEARVSPSYFGNTPIRAASLGSLQGIANMSRSFSANQYEQDFSPRALGNWEVPAGQVRSEQFLSML